MGTDRGTIAPAVSAASAGPASYRYAAFISYRHAEPDRRWAKWLHRRLETYRVPRRLAREQGLLRRIGRCFRDEEELPASSDLSREIDAALEQSKFLIVICSPNTPASEWVNREVERFREMGRHDRILALLVEGEPADSFPRSLREIRRDVVDGRGLTRHAIEKVEPLAADVRPTRHERRGHLGRMAKLRLAACLLGVRLDDLRQREQERRVWFLAGAGAVLAAVALAFAGLAVLATSQRAEAVRQRGEADHQRDDARRATARAEASDRAGRRQLAEVYTLNGLGRLDAGDPAPAALWFVAASAAEDAAGGDPARVSLARVRIATALNASPRPLDVPAAAAPAPAGDPTRHGGRRLAVSGWFVEVQRDGGDGPPVGPRLAHDGLVTAAAFSPDGSRVVTASRDGTARVWDAATGKPVTPPLAHADEVRSAAFDGDGSMVVTVAADQTARVWDAATGAPLTPPLLHLGLLSAAWFGPDGSTVVTAGYDRTAPVIDPDTGAALGTKGDGPIVLRTWEAVAGRPLAGVPAVGRSGAVGRRPPDGPRPRPAGRRVAYVPGVGDVSAVSEDGAKAVACYGDGTARVCDVHTGRALTPLLTWGSGAGPEAAPLAGFGRDGASVFVIAGRQVTVTWSIAADPRPAADLKALSELLSCRRLDDAKGPVPLTADEYRGRWDDLRRKYPDEFRPRPAPAAADPSTRPTSGPTTSPAG